MCRSVEDLDDGEGNDALSDIGGQEAGFAPTSYSRGNTVDQDEGERCTDGRWDPLCMAGEHPDGSKARSEIGPGIAEVVGTPDRQ